MLTYPNKPPKIEIASLPIRIFGKIEHSFVDGRGVRYVIFTQGCPRDCPGCHNPGSHSPDGGMETTTDALWREIRDTRMINGVTFSGGEPFMWARELALIGEAVRKSKMDVWTYTGYKYEELLDMAAEDEAVRSLLTVTNVLVDGEFIKEKRDWNLRFRGSSNQRILDITCYPNTADARIMEEMDDD